MKYLSTPAALGLATLAAALAAPAALAQNAAPISSGWYMGGNIGRTTQDADNAAITNGLAAQGLATTSINSDDRDRGYKVFGGYQLNRNFAIEGGYFDLGSFGYTAQTAPLGSQSGDVRYKGMNLDLVGILPFTDKLSAIGRVGVTSTKASGSYSATGAAGVPFGNANPSERTTNPKVGVGLMYDFTPSLGVRVEAERYRVKDAFRNKNHVDMMSVGLVYRFGAAPVRTAQAAPAPVYVAPAPAPAPVYVAPAPAPAPVYVAPPAPAPVMAPEPRPAKPYRN
ncbi:MAG: outer membrane beta-barrel protein [Ramlibacter sp.]|nr:outer membrane beta-barrel protein [Ramlibacter sp.]